MTSGERRRCSKQHRRRLRLPVPMDRIPTLQPVREIRRTKPKRSAFRTFLHRVMNRIRRLEFVPGSCNRMWRDGQTNPATGLGMYGGVDAAGNPYGTGMRISWSRHDASAVQRTALPDLPPFHSDRDPPRVTLDSIDQRWGSDCGF